MMIMALIDMCAFESACRLKLSLVATTLLQCIARPALGFQLSIYFHFLCTLIWFFFFCRGHSIDAAATLLTVPSTRIDHPTWYDYIVGADFYLEASWGFPSFKWVLVFNVLLSFFLTNVGN